MTPFVEGKLCLKCDAITYEKQGEVLTVRLREGNHETINLQALGTIQPLAPKSTGIKFCFRSLQTEEN